MKELEKENEDLETQIEYRRKQNASMTLMNHEDECDGRGERSPSEGEPLSSVVVFGSSVQCAFSEISGQRRSGNFWRMRAALCVLLQRKKQKARPKGVNQKVR